MKRKRLIIHFGLLPLLCLTLCVVAGAQETQQPGAASEEFGPVVRAYLGYLHDEQEVVDDRASRHEISPQYYRRNSNRIRALRQIALSIARETGNDYLPELEATTRDELGTLFEQPPSPRTFRTGEVINNTFRYLGAVRAGDLFYVFARLDPYEQAELMEKAKQTQPGEAKPVEPPPSPADTNGQAASHPRRSSKSSP
jgi:outer membrane protein TolC